MEVGFNAIYTMNISAQSAMTGEIFPQMMIFFVAFALDHKHKGQISIQLPTAVLNPSRPLRF